MSSSAVVLPIYIASVSDKAITGAGILGGLASVIGEFAVKDVYYLVTVDIQINELIGAKKRPSGKRKRTVLRSVDLANSYITLTAKEKKVSFPITRTPILLA